jgi:hypothetical protein
MQKDGQLTNPESSLPKTSRKMRIMIVVVLVILTVQGWFGDTTNIFVTTSSITAPLFSIAGFFHTAMSQGFILAWHTTEGILLFFLSIAVLGLSFVWSKARSVRILAVLGIFAVFSAALGGYLFTLSGFSNGGNSAQMGGSFIGAYAAYFIMLYYAK